MILTHHGIDSMVRPGGGGTEYEVTIGESSISPSRYRTQLPWDGENSYSLSQQIYSANEIGTSGKITDISFYCFVGYLSWNVSIYMSHTSKASLSDLSKSEKLQNNEYVQDTSLVYNGSVYLGSTDNKWFKIPLSTPFEYDNSHNLLLTVCSNNPSNPSKELRFAVLQNNSNISLYKSRYTSEYKPTTTTYTSMNTDYFRNVIKLNMLV